MVCHRLFTAGRGLWSRVGLGAGPGAQRRRYAVPVTRYGPCLGEVSLGARPLGGFDEHIWPACAGQ